MKPKSPCLGVALLALAALARLPGGAAAQSRFASVVARVVDDSTGAPLSGAYLTISGTALGAYSDSNGVIRVQRIPAGRRILAVGMLAYRTEQVLVDFEPGRAVDADLRLTIDPVALAAVEVMGERRDPYLLRHGFYQRSRFGGTFLFGRKLEERVRGAARLSDLFQGVFGLHVVGSPDGMGHILLPGRGIGTMGQGGSCYPQVFLDGMDTHWEKQSYPDVDRLMEPSNVAAVEVYAGPAETPAELGDRPCGVVLLWSRHQH